jgi:hypothetical protein
MGEERRARRGMLYGALVISVLVLASAQPSAAFYEKGSDVLMLDSTSYMPKIAKSNFLWLVGGSGRCCPGGRGKGVGGRREGKKRERERERRTQKKKKREA